MYAIKSLCPRTDITMGAHGFTIDLAPEWKAAVLASGLTQEFVDTRIEHFGNDWLAACGWTDWFDPENCGWEKDPTKPPGPASRRSPDFRAIRVTWGPWGPEHITVPGNACGLDLDCGCGVIFKDGMALLPHNIDAWRQKQLLLIVFTDLAECVLLQACR